MSSVLENFDFTPYTGPQLRAFEKRLQVAISNSLAADIKKANELIDAILKEVDIPRSEFLKWHTPASRVGKTRKASGPVPIQFIDPADPQNTWTGRGRPPKWVTKYEDSGVSRETFRVKPD